MVRRIWVTVAIAPLLLLQLQSCGGVEIGQNQADPLKLISLYPRHGEINISTNIDVIAIFSDKVSEMIGADLHTSDSINSSTFMVKRADGLKVDAAITFSETDDKTVMLKGLSLDPGAQYSIIIDEKVSGLETEPMGVEIETTFTVAID